MLEHSHLQQHLLLILHSFCFILLLIVLLYNPTDLYNIRLISLNFQHAVCLLKGHCSRKFCSNSLLFYYKTILIGSLNTVEIILFQRWLCSLQQQHHLVGFYFIFLLQQQNFPPKCLSISTKHIPPRQTARSF